MGKSLDVTLDHFKKKTPYRLLVASGLLIAFLLIAGTSNLSANAQLASRWSPLQQIPNYDYNSRPPHMVADKNRTVHAFNFQPVEGGEMAIFYRQWTVERGWTTPVDIILPGPNAGVEPINDVFLDQSGIIHLIYFNSTVDGDSIYYSKAPATEAGNAYAWSTPKPVGIKSGSLFSAAMIGDSEGNLTVVYSGKAEGIGLYEVHSSDSGDTWSDPTKIFLINQENRWPYSIRLAYDRQGRLHAVWGVVSDRGVGEGIYYARLEADRSLWSPPIQLAAREGLDYSTHWPAIAVYNDKLIAVYQDSFPATLYMRQSSDFGQTWSPPIRPWDHEGETENPVLLIDSNNVLHVVHGNRFGDPIIGGMWHSVWLNNRWSEFEPVVVMGGSSTNPQAEDQSAWFAPSGQEAIISQGNVLLVTWWNNVIGDLRTGSWYSYTKLDAPELPVEPLPTPKPTVTPNTLVISEALNGTPQPTRTPLYSGQAGDSSVGQATNNTMMPIIAGAAPVILLIALAFIFYANYYRTR